MRCRRRRAPCQAEYGSSLFLAMWPEPLENLTQQEARVLGKRGVVPSQCAQQFFPNRAVVRMTPCTQAGIIQWPGLSVESAAPWPCRHAAALLPISYFDQIAEGIGDGDFAIEAGPSGAISMRMQWRQFPIQGR